MALIVNLSIFRRNRNYTFLYIGQFVSFFGTMITSVALPYQIYMMTHSTLLVGLLSLVQLLPLLFTALIGGVFADRYHRRRLLLSSECILAIGTLLLTYNATLSSPSILLIFVVSSIMSAFNGLHRPALESIVQQIVHRKDFATVGSLATFKASIGMIAGPAVGGILIASYGLVFTYLIDFLTFMISLIALLLMTDIPKPKGKIDVSTLAALSQGLKYAVSRQELLGTYIVDFVAMIFGMPTALFPALAVSYGGGAKTLGYLFSSVAVGALVISLFSGWTMKVKRHGLAIAIAASLWGVAIILFGLAPNFTWAVICLAFAGAFDAVSGIFRSVMWNETIPQHLRGRLAGIEMISYLSGPKLGDTEAGLVAAAFGVTFSIVSGGVMCIIGVATCAYFLPKFIHYHCDKNQHALIN